ncbi:Protein-tyrosine-phosphatase [Albimonas donghaensis]|uniref:Protein-tyrosine-phosphatase n=1 Tax=Albimonas donghaensis TaxID=356660 RepID=A0A1H2QEE8_9RHOB|nr:helix-turn-helix domain-containing protein [Albimonas donghaensis]SDW05178.1 Protein-tyrosine-phosphatase [Albimonas donghaensis]
MNLETTLEGLGALAHAGRMSVFRLLARRAPETVSAGDLARALDLKASTLSVYLSILTRAGLVRQERAGRFIRYGIDLDNLGQLVEHLVNDCGRGRPEILANLVGEAPRPTGLPAEDVCNVLFVCTGNSARSIFAEALLEQLGGGRFRAFSAGTSPYPALNPFTEEVLRAEGHDVSKYRPKPVDMFYEPNAPKMDFVFTVCDHAANEECPPLPGQPVSAHWGMADPVRLVGSVAEQALAFRQTYGGLQRRLEAFVALPFTRLNRLSLQRKLDAIGRSSGDIPSLRQVVLEDTDD